MSYSLVFTHHPVPNSDPEAWKWEEKMIEPYYEDEREAHSTLKELHDKLTDKYPCICTLPDESVDDGVWSDGPLINNFSGDLGMVAFGFSRTEEILPFILNIAKELGITTFDHQTQSIHQAQLARKVG